MRIILAMFFMFTFLVGFSSINTTKELPINQSYQDVKTILNQLVSFYEREELQSFMGLVSKKFTSMPYERFEDRVEGDFLNFNQIDIDLIIEKTIPDADNYVAIYTHWRMKWMPRNQPDFVFRQGKSIFIFIKEEDRFKLSDIKEDVLFGVTP